MSKPTTWHKIWRTLAAVKTGIILLIIVGITSAAGTFVLQRPITDPDKMARAYSPQTLAVLDRIGMTDVFHAWWFILLMGVFSLSILAVSIDRWPDKWRYFSRPYRETEPHFRAVLPLRKEIPIPNEELGLAVAERAMRESHLDPHRVGGDKSKVSALFAERGRIARMGVYLVHASLLFILVGGIIDGTFGYQSYVTLIPGQSKDELKLSNGQVKKLSFALRCDGTGQENYPDGFTPKRWWSKLAVIENGRDVYKKEIEVNSPLDWDGLRFYQAGFGSAGIPEFVQLQVTPLAGGEAREIKLRPNESVKLDADTEVSFNEFVPDFIAQDGQIYKRSDNPDNPAFHLAVKTKDGAQATWVFARYPEFNHQDPKIPYKFQFVNLAMANYTGLQVSYHPGQWSVWAGCLLMALGMVVVFYIIHMRYWVVPVRNEAGELVLWVGASGSKSNELVQDRFIALVGKIEEELKLEIEMRGIEHEMIGAGR